MTEVELKRGYEILHDNNVRFGIRVINSSDYAISVVEVILDYDESLFVLEGSKMQKLGTIPPALPRTAKFILKPLACIHKEEIAATIRYKDHLWKRHTLEMRAKEVHCVCPFLNEKSLTRADFLSLSNSGYLEERGVNFEGITVDKLVDFILHTCKNRLYRVDEFSIENDKILYLAGDALGEKAYYLLTAVVAKSEGIVQVLLRAASDKKHGLNGFLKEILDNLHHLVSSTSAREIGVIKKEQVINIIDSVVQRTTFPAGEGAASVTIKDSVVQHTEIKGDDEKRRRQEEERLRAEKEEQERLHREEKEKKERERRVSKTVGLEQQILAHESGVFALQGILALGIGFLVLILPGMTLVTFIIFVGVFALVDGILAFVALTKAEIERRGLLILHGVCGITFGLIFILWPVNTTTAILWLIMLWILVIGIFKLVAAFKLQSRDASKWLLALNGILSLVVGVLLIALPMLEGLEVLALLLGLYAVIAGILLICLAGAEWSKRKHMQTG